MRRYWQALKECVREDDPFVVTSVIEPCDMLIPPGLRGMASRYWHRTYGYPATIRNKFSGDIGHIMDHSWADMLPHLPERTLKVVTVHDLIPLRFSGELRPSQAGRFRSWVSHIKDADAIIADSEYTKHEVENLLNISPELIKVVPCGVAKVGEPEAGGPLFPANSAALTVGSIGSVISRKNLGILPAAFSKFIESNKTPLRLVRVGASLPVSLSNELKGLLGAANVIELGFLSDDEVGRFYQAMDVVVVPSLYEGFGLPVLEALAHGVPVISSNTTSLPEVGGEEALYFDPNSPEELAAQLSVVSKGMGGGWKERAVARADGFSWRASLEGIYNVYDLALERRQRGIARGQ